MMDCIHRSSRQWSLTRSKTPVRICPRWSRRRVARDIPALVAGCGSRLPSESSHQPEQQGNVCVLACVCMCACVHACVCACVHVRARACARVHVRVWRGHHLFRSAAHNITRKQKQLTETSRQLRIEEQFRGESTSTMCQEQRRARLMYRQCHQTQNVNCRQIPRCSKTVIMKRGWEQEAG